MQKNENALKNIKDKGQIQSGTKDKSKSNNNNNVNQNYKENRHKRLELKKTLIGKIEGKWKNVPMNFDIYYGNYCISDQKIEEVDDMLMLPIEQYVALLKQFLQSKQGSEYIVPSVDEINKDVMKIRTEYNLSKQKKVEDSNTDNTNIEAPSNDNKEESTKTAVHEESLDKDDQSIDDVEQKEKDDEVNTKTNDVEAKEENQVHETNNRAVAEAEEPRDKVYTSSKEDSDKSKKSKHKKNEKKKAKDNPLKEPITLDKRIMKVLFVMLLINIACFALNSYQFLQMRRQAELNITEQIQVEINGQEMSLPINKYDLNVGETKVNLYAISSTQTEDGLVNNALPLGEINFMPKSGE